MTTKKEHKFMLFSKIKYYINGLNIFLFYLNNFDNPLKSIPVNTFKK